MLSVWIECVDSITFTQSGEGRESNLIDRIYNAMSGHLDQWFTLHLSDSLIVNDLSTAVALDLRPSFRPSVRPSVFFEIAEARVSTLVGERKGRGGEGKGREEGGGGGGRIWRLASQTF